ncbi:hypothetical protein ACFFX1_47950 [Dactylosporangium sucinum]|uniref:Tetratricopeptide repeat protein n=1 Tax=Dactylosporangium sucinum TaxID=1424081 RepID=A0A917TNR9_9ACTN|nr:hypothetical protein [Dactylosporangium sucinum]GGM29488.1 hypothetical protein GCM10007977_033470 [Dactylosporangium sucinum]
MSLAKVMAHCGGSPAEALRHLAAAVAQAPHDPEPYAEIAELRDQHPDEVARLVARPDTLPTVLADAYLRFVDGDMDRAALAMGTLTGQSPQVSWAGAPWFGSGRFLGTVGAPALADATMCLLDFGHDLDSDDMRERLAPWFTAIDAVTARDPLPEAMARMAILLRACGMTDASLALCDRADAAGRVALTEVVRGSTHRARGDRRAAAAAFERAVGLDPGNWSVLLDLADLAAEEGDFAAAAGFAGRGEALAPPAEVTVRAAAAAYRARSTGSIADLDAFVELAPLMPNPWYRAVLAGRAAGGEGLPPDRAAAARALG